jgi:hypothetical protein
MLVRSLVLAGLLGAAALAQSGSAGAVDREACFSSAESAQQLRAQNKLRGARDALLVCAQVGCPGSVQKDCTKWLGEVKDALPTVVFAAHDARGNDLADVSVTLDDVKVADTLDGRPVEIDPGPHVLRYDRAGSSSTTKSVVIAAGQKLREIAVEMAQEAGAATAATAQRPPFPLPSIVLGAVGAAALVSMTAFWISGRSGFSSLETSCSPSCDPSRVDPVRAELVVGDVSAGVALVSLGLATWFYFGRPRTTAPSVGFAPSAHGGLATLELAF